MFVSFNKAKKLQLCQKPCEAVLRKFFELNDNVPRITMLACGSPASIVFTIPTLHARVIKSIAEVSKYFLF